MYLLLSEKGNKYIIKKPGEYVYEEGKIIIEEKDLKSLPTHKTSSTGIKMLLTQPTYQDIFDKMFKRGAQIIHEKDLGYIIRKFITSQEMKILEAGAGSGHATIFLSFFSKEVISYEKNERFYNLSKQNISLFGISNIKIIKGDVKDAPYRDYFDLVLFDFKDSTLPQYITKVKELLKPGGYGVWYLPVIEQVVQAITNLKKSGFVEISFKEIILRDWKISPIRPKNKMLGHTAFIVSARRFE